MMVALWFALWGHSAWAVPSSFTFTDLDGKPAVIQPVEGQDRQLVVFWGTWCTDCRSKLKNELVDLAKKGIQVVTVNLDTDLRRAKHFVAREGISLPIVADPSGEYRKSLGVYSVPHWAAYRRDSKGVWNLVKSEAAFNWSEVQKSLGLGG